MGFEAVTRRKAAEATHLGGGAENYGFGSRTGRRPARDVPFSKTFEKALE